MDNQGLEAGLSYIGLVLEAAERQIAEFWAAYEERSRSKRNIATVKYPDRYSLKTDSDRITEAQSLVKLMYAVPGQKVKRELAKNIVLALLGGKISVGDIQAIFDEIDKAPYATSDPTTIIAAVEAGLCGEKTGSMALGFNDDEHIQARADHAARAIRILQAQQRRRDWARRPPGPPTAIRLREKLAGSESTALSEVVGKMNSDAGARGVPDLSANAGAGKKRRRPAAIPRSRTQRSRPFAEKANKLNSRKNGHDRRSSRCARVLDGCRHLRHHTQATQDRQLSVAEGRGVAANSGNAKAICVGNSDAKNTGYILGPGERTPLLQVDNINKLYVVASDGTQGYSWFAC